MLRKVAYPIEIRALAIRHIQEGKSGADVSKLLGVSRATISRWMRRESLAASPKGGSKPRELPVDLLEYVQNNPYKTIAQLAEGLPIKRSALLKRLHQAKITFKKSFTYREADPIKHKAHLEKIAQIEPKNIFYLDESGFDSRRVNDSGWAMRGERLCGKKEGQRPKVRQSVVDLRNHKHKLLCAMVYEGTMKKERFKGYLEKALRVLPKGSVIVLDNASCHTSLKIEPILAETESRLLYLPPYSPDMNPIEKIWSCVKTRLKKIYRYITEDFFEAICAALSEYADPELARVSF